MKLSWKSKLKKGEDDIGRNKFSAYNEEPGDEKKKKKRKNVKKTVKKLFSFPKVFIT